MDQFHIGQRVLYRDFGEGTIVKIDNDQIQAVVAFSEVETFDLPTSELSLITID